ncbi:MAG TPA: hypothetical protein VKU94_00740 [Geobacterales bacterium]|nr:hypothetical protein [Geobacterales bacterium]
MEEGQKELNRSLVISFILNSFFCVAMLFYGASSIIGGDLSPLGIGALVLGAFLGIMLRNVYRNITENAKEKIQANLNLMGTVNTIVSIILFALVLASIILQYYLQPDVGLDLIVLYALYYSALLLGLGLFAGLYTLRSSRAIL